MENMWWTHIRQAMDFVEEITEKAYLGQSLLLAFPNQVPWSDELFDAVEAQLRTRNPEFRAVMLREEDGDPEPLMLDRFCRRETRARYRSAIGAAKFLAEQPDSTLHSSYVWVRISSDTAMKKWISFASEYVRCIKNGEKKGAFIIECSNMGSVSRVKGLHVLDWSVSIDSYDAFTYCALCSSNVSISKSLRAYLVDLAANVCQTDVELGQACINQGRGLLEDPETALRQIAESEVRSSGEPFEIEINPENLQTKTWESQVRIAFSVIEKLRMSFVNKYSRDIMRCLPITDAYGNTIDTLQKVELGQVLRFVGERKVVVSPADYDKIAFLRDCRNDLAHIKPLCLEDLAQLLEM